MTSTGNDDFDKRHLLGIIREQRQRISNLNATAEKLTDRHEFDLARVALLENLLREVLGCGIEYEAINYKLVQLGATLRDDIERALEWKGKT